MSAVVAPPRNGGGIMAAAREMVLTVDADVADVQVRRALPPPKPMAA
jgi:hypothetical protein